MQGGSVVFEKKIIKYEKQQFSRIGVRGGSCISQSFKKRKEIFMDLLGIAEELENSAVLFYQDLAKSAKIGEFSSIFNDLAREERKHFEIFEKWRKNERLPDLENFVPQVTDSATIFAYLSEQFNAGAGEFTSRSQIFKMALELERKSIDHYRRLIESSDLTISAHRSLVERIIAQEENHIRAIDALAEFQRHPGEWLENAEFNHRDEY
jgi:rubrerythrin